MFNIVQLTSQLNTSIRGAVRGQATAACGSHLELVTDIREDWIIDSWEGPFFWLKVPTSAFTLKTIKTLQQTVN